MMNDELRTANGIHHSSFITHPLFVVHTPTATVTDLGTEFGVLVDRLGVTESYVFRGAVRVQPCSAAHYGQKDLADLVIRENESIRIEKPTAAGSQQRVAVTRQTAEPGRFVANCRRPQNRCRFTCGPISAWARTIRRDAQAAGR